MLIAVKILNAARLKLGIWQAFRLSEILRHLTAFYKFCETRSTNGRIKGCCKTIYYAIKILKHTQHTTRLPVLFDDIRKYNAWLNTHCTPSASWGNIYPTQFIIDNI